MFRVKEVKRFSVIMSEKKMSLKRKGELRKGPEKRGGGEAGWLQEKVLEIRRNSAECKFNPKRLRFLSDAQRVRQGCGAVLYWMVRDQRVQGNHLKTTTTGSNLRSKVGERIRTKMENNSKQKEVNRNGKVVFVLATRWRCCIILHKAQKKI